MKITNGRILIFLGIIHAMLSVSPFAFGKQFNEFTGSFLFKISEGLFEFPLLDGQMNYENFAAFWFFYFGILLIPLGILVDYVEKEVGEIPTKFTLGYLMVVLLGVYMIPFSGMTFLMLPHAIYMLINNKQLLSS